MMHVKGWNKLNSEMREIFMKIYRRHLRAMGEAEREKHNESNLVEIKVNQKEQCFDVYYNHEHYKYFSDGTWG